jgi:hypothetical protein
VWNFGKLESEDEQLIIKRMVFNEKFLKKIHKQVDESGKTEIKIGEPVEMKEGFRQFIANAVFTC